MLNDIYLFNEIILGNANKMLPLFAFMSYTRYMYNLI